MAATLPAAWGSSVWRIKRSLDIRSRGISVQLQADSFEVVASVPLTTLRTMLPLCVCYSTRTQALVIPFVFAKWTRDSISLADNSLFKLPGTCRVAQPQCALCSSPHKQSLAHQGSVVQVKRTPVLTRLLKYAACSAKIPHYPA